MARQQGRTPLEIPYSSYSFRRWLESENFTGQNGEFIDRLKRDNLAPHSIGPRTPATLMNYIMRMIDTPTSRVEYKVTDVPIVWNLWNIWLFKREGSNAAG